MFVCLFVTSERLWKHSSFIAWLDLVSFSCFLLQIVSAYILLYYLTKLGSFIWNTNIMCMKIISDHVKTLFWWSMSICSYILTSANVCYIWLSRDQIVWNPLSHCRTASKQIQRHFLRRFWRKRRMMTKQKIPIWKLEPQHGLENPSPRLEIS